MDSSTVVLELVTKSRGWPKVATDLQPLKVVPARHAGRYRVWIDATDVVTARVILEEKLDSVRTAWRDEAYIVDPSQ
jgi:hypothetical protein